MEEEVLGAEVLAAGRPSPTGPPRPFVRNLIFTPWPGKPLAACEQGSADEIYILKWSLAPAAAVEDHREAE